MADWKHIHFSEYESYASIIDTYKDLAYSIALKITRNEQDAEEIVQDSFVKAFQGLQSFKNDSQFSTWFYRIVYNSSISAMRKKKIPLSDLAMEELNSKAPVNFSDASHNLNQHDRKRIIQAAMEKLGKLDYTIITLFYYESKSLKEIAVITGKNRNYLKVLLQRARRKLYKGLDPSIKSELKELL